MSMNREDDIQTVAKALVHNAVRFSSQSNGPDIQECIYCGAWEKDSPREPAIKHKLDCPVLVAKDLLT